VLAKQHSLRQARPNRTRDQQAREPRSEGSRAIGAEASSARRCAKPRRQASDPQLTVLDLRILDLLSSQRVLTSPQLAALSPETPARTLRYRCSRLARLGLVGRTRPYRERGSAPHHLWPTRKGEAVVTGSSPSRGGERREPNPLFLAHAAGLTELYVVLETTLPAEVRLARFEREADAREPFTTWIKREARAIAPDVFIEITDADGRKLCAFVELDMGTMSHRQLKKKAAGYAEYVRASAWRKRHRFCPALLFITTTEKRARSFLLAMRREVGRDALLLTCACDLARKLRCCATEASWLVDDEGGQAVDLLAVLREARRPYDEELAHKEAARREKEAKREQLRSDPSALRDHLRSWRHRDWGIERLGRVAADALEITIGREGQLGEIERRALLALGTMFADPLCLQLGEREPAAEDRIVLDQLAEYQRVRQLDDVGDLARRFGEGPALREARRRLQAGELLTASDLSWLPQKAADDKRSRTEQERLRSGYLAWRAGEAQRRAKEQRLVARLRNRPEAFLEEIDLATLRLCGSCEEIAYPDPKRARYEGGRRNVAFRCHFCGGTTLVEFKP
jgi:hypothetical protein